MTHNVAPRLISVIPLLTSFVVVSVRNNKENTKSLFINGICKRERSENEISAWTLITMRFDDEHQCGIEHTCFYSLFVCRQLRLDDGHFCMFSLPLPRRSHNLDNYLTHATDRFFLSDCEWFQLTFQDLFHCL